MRVAAFTCALSSVLIVGVIVQSQPLQSQAIRTTQPTETPKEQSVKDIVKNSSDAVVLIVTKDHDGHERSLGSGFIVSDDGKVLTNYHVIKGAGSAIVKLSNGAFFPVEGVLATDEAGDMALLKVAGNRLPYLKLADSSELTVGEHVVAIGSPLGLQNTVSDGIVSAIRSEKGHQWIQTTAPVSPGNSGGPLIRSDGTVTGIITWGVRGENSENLNFAIPVNAARPLMNGTSVAVPLDRESTGTGFLQGKEIWTSLNSGKDYKIRFDGEFIYTEWVNLPSGLKGTMAFLRGELKKTGDTWKGRGTQYSPCEIRTWTGPQIKWCRVEMPIEITKVSASRIEGRSEAYGAFDCRKCQPKDPQMKDFVWIPKE